MIIFAHVHFAALKYSRLGTATNSIMILDYKESLIILAARESPKLVRVPSLLVSLLRRRRAVGEQGWGSSGLASLCGRGALREPVQRSELCGAAPGKGRGLKAATVRTGCNKWIQVPVAGCGSSVEVFSPVQIRSVKTLAIS